MSIFTTRPENDTLHLSREQSTLPEKWHDRQAQYHEPPHAM